MDKVFDVTAVVLAGGMSRRMGFDKAMLNFHGSTLLSHIIRRMRYVFDRVLIAGADPARYPDAQAPVVPDLLEGQGALVGLHAGLKAANTERIFAIACDSPFPRSDLIRYLVHVAPHADWVAPQTDKGVEPLFAVYSQNCVQPMEEMFAQGDHRIVLLAEMVDAVFVPEERIRDFDTDLRSFFNINTPEDLAKII